MRGRLDDEKLETLRGWGTGLVADERDELRAAGKAILILIEEIERLQVEVWHVQDASPASRPGAAVGQPSPDVAGETLLEPAQPPAELEPTLRGRIRRVLDQLTLSGR